MLSESPAPIVVAFTGFKSHGKDTAAQTLIDNHGFVRVSFADGLRKTVCTALRCEEDWFLDPAKKEEIDPRTGKSRRWWLQWIGTEGFRSQWDDIWVNWWKQEIIEKGYKRVVTTDMRFPNEAIAVQNSGFRELRLRVDNPNKPPSGDLHASEIHIPNLPVWAVLHNGGSIEDLQQLTRTTVENLFPELR